MIIVKLLGSILILIGSTGVGILKALEYKDQIEEMKEIYDILLMLKSETVYVGSTLQEVFFTVSKKTKDPYNKWLEKLSEDLERKNRRSFFEMWENAVDQELCGLILKKEEMGELKMFGRQLGGMDKETQTASIELYMERLQMKIDRYTKEFLIKRRLCHCLGVMGGVFLIVIFM